MAIPTQFSVTNKATRPIANPDNAQDLANVINAESIGFISGASSLPSKAAVDTGAAVIIDSENAPSQEAASSLPVIAQPSIDNASAATTQNAPAFSAPSAIAPNAGSLIAPPFPLNHARILYENLFQDSVVTASIGSNPEYVRVPNTYQAWAAQPSAEAASITLSNFESGVVIDTICIGAHNLSDVTGTVRFETSTTDAGAFTLRDERTITTNAAIMWHTETPIAIKRIRITAVNATGLFKVGYISAGVALQMQRPFFNGHQPYTDSDVTEYYAKRTESGERIGRDIRRKGFETSYEWQNLDDVWYRQYIPDFKEAVKTKPVFIAWNYMEYRDDVAFGDITDDISSSMQNGTRVKRSGFGFTVVGV